MKNLHESMGQVPPVVAASVGRPLNIVGDSCSEHGAFVVDEQINGVWYAKNPGGCPHCLAARRAKRLMVGLNMPARFSDASFDNYVCTTEKQLSVLSACRDYAANFAEYRGQGRGLILSGQVGTGKNHLATAIFKALVAMKFTALRVKASEFLEAFWAKEFNERDAWVRGVARVDLLMVDEVGRSSSGQNAQNVFFRLIDARYENSLPTLICSNLNRTELIETLGDAAYDRLRQGGTKLYTLNWDSYRATAHMGGHP